MFCFCTYSISMSKRLESNKRMREMALDLESILNEQLSRRYGSVENAERHFYQLRQSAANGLTCCGNGGLCGKTNKVCVFTTSKCDHVVCKDCAEEIDMERESYVKTKKCPIAGCRRMMTFY